MKKGGQLFKFAIDSLLFFSMLLLLANCKPKEPEPEFLLRTALLVKEDHTWYKAFAYFGELLEERSNGRIKVELYPS